MTIPDTLLVDLFYAAQGDITKFRLKARALLQAPIEAYMASSQELQGREYAGLVTSDVHPFALMCDALPADFMWGDPLTPDVFRHIESVLATRDASPRTIATIDSYVVPLNGFEYKVQRVHQTDGNYLWKAMHGSNCLSKSGEFEYEPLPSSRDDAFLARCRFATAVDAIDALTAAVPAQTNEDGK